jgi:hypothetical protein
MALEWEEDLGDEMLEESKTQTSVQADAAPIAPAAFIRQSFETVLKLHEEILSSKDAQIRQLEDENRLLKESLLGIQKLYEEDRELLQLLKKEIFDLQEELEFTRRKYKMMWNQAIENYAKK